MQRAFGKLTNSTKLLPASVELLTTIMSESSRISHSSQNAMRHYIVYSCDSCVSDLQHIIVVPAGHTSSCTPNLIKELCISPLMFEASC